MASHLQELGLVRFARYDTVSPTVEGRQLGEFLLFRHRTLQEFFCRLNGTEDELEQVEKVEHFISGRTLASICRLLRQPGFPPWRDPSVGQGASPRP